MSKVPKSECDVEIFFVRLRTLLVASSQALPDPLPKKNKKGESPEDFDHVQELFLSAMGLPRGRSALHHYS